MFLTNSPHLDGLDRRALRRGPGASEARPLGVTGK